MYSKPYSRNDLLCFFMVTLMLVIQLALAQHAMIHFSPQRHTAAPMAYDAGSTQNTGKDAPKTPDKFCPLCSFAKSFSQTLISPSLLTLKMALLQISIPPSLQIKHSQTVANAYLAQAPPSLS